MLLLVTLIASSLASVETDGGHSDLWVWLESPEDKALVRELGFGFVESQQEQWWRVHGELGSEGLLDAAGINHRPAHPVAWMTDGHHSPEKMNLALSDLASSHPDSAEYVDLGRSVAGRPIVGLRLGRSFSPERKMRILGAHHGDETASAEVSLTAARTLLTSEAYASFLDTNEVWVVPHVNPDGIVSVRRYNDNSVALNRNYGFEWSDSAFRSGDAPFSEPETQAIRTLASWVDFGLGLSVHSGATNLGWVWNHTVERSPDEDLLSMLAESYAEECLTDGFWLTNGADWYVTHGDTTDWSYGRHGTLDYTLEVSRNKNPDSDEMALVQAEHAEAIPAILDWPWWISGFVQDAETGEAIMASVSIEENEWILTSGHDGHFSRPVYNGEWDLTFSAPGYQTERLRVSTDLAPVMVELERTEVSNVWPESRWISDAGNFTLDRDVDSVQLFRSGHPTVTAVPDAGAWTVDLTDLTPGPWSLLINGSPAPNRLFVPDWSGFAHVTSIDIVEASIHINVVGLGKGTRVWAMWGDWRNPVPVTILSETEDTLILDATPLPLEEQVVDLVIWTRGTQIGIDDVQNFLPSDPSEDTDDTGVQDTGVPINEGHDTGEDSGDSTSETQASDTGHSSEGSGSHTQDQPNVENLQNDSIVRGKGELKAGGCQAHPHHYRGLMWLVSLLPLLLCRRSP